MKIKHHGAIIEVSDEEFEALYNFLETVDILKVWYEGDCTYEQIAMGLKMRSTMRDHLNKMARSKPVKRVEDEK